MAFTRRALTKTELLGYLVELLEDESVELREASVSLPTKIVESDGFPIVRGYFDVSFRFERSFRTREELVEMAPRDVDAGNTSITVPRSS